jgi:hypothetical protein
MKKCVLPLIGGGCRFFVTGEVGARNASFEGNFENEERLVFSNGHH